MHGAFIVLSSGMLRRVGATHANTQLSDTQGRYDITIGRGAFRRS